MRKGSSQVRASKKRENGAFSAGRNFFWSSQFAIRKALKKRGCMLYQYTKIIKKIPILTVIPDMGGNPVCKGGIAKGS